jgi:photosystem II stability/assembly factor-like uncharacterized protein
LKDQALLHFKRTNCRGGFLVFGTILLSLALFSVLLLAPVANAETDVTDLDLPAILAKAPARVFLDAVAPAGARLVAVGEHGVVIYSDDTGVSWHQAKVPVDVLLTAVAFATPMDGWASGHFGVILHTGDGGITWQKQIDGREVDQLAVRAAQVATAEHSTQPTAPLAEKRAARFLDEGPDKPFLAIQVLSSNAAIVVGAYRMAERTSDGGRTWQDMSLDVGDPLSHNLYDITQAGTDFYIACETGLVFRSVDQGQTFPEVSPTGDATLFGILGTRDGGVFTFGVAGSAYLSHDGGTTWKAISVGTQSSLVAGIVLKSGAILLASESGTLYISYDNGQSFGLLPQIIPMAIAGLAQANTGAVAVVGSRGVSMLPAADFAQAK